jgi:hypothetical protein
MSLDACTELAVFVESFCSWWRIITSVPPDASFARQIWRYTSD